MKKILLRLMFLAMLVALLPVQVAQACSAFIVGKDLTADGSTLFGRTEDYPYAPDGGRHNQNYVVVPAKTYKDGDKIEDESNGFTYPHLANEMKYTAVYDSDRDNGSNGNFAAHGFNELGVAMTATVSATPNDKVLKEDPLVKDGLPEASLVDLALPRANKMVVLLFQRIVKEAVAFPQPLIFYIIFLRMTDNHFKILSLKSPSLHVAW